MTHETDQERVRSALSFLDYNDEDVWIDAAMGLKSEFGDAGFDIWEAWGSQYERYNAKEARARWKSVKAGGRKTIASLFYDAKAAGWQDDKKYAKPSREEIERRKAAAAARQAQAEAEEAEARAAAQQHAQFMWERAQPLEGDDHPYLKSKSVSSHGLRVGAWEKLDHENGEVNVISERALLVPIRDDKKQIHSLQAIFAGKVMGDRDKDFVTDGAKSGHFYSFGKPVTVDVQGEQRAVILVGEGYATLASAHAATGHACIVAFDAGNVPKVARVLRARFPHHALVFLADNDQWTDGNPGVTKAREAAAAVGGLVAVPPFDYSEGKPGKDGKLRGPSDFNDLHQLRGLDAVREVIEAALEGRFVDEYPAARAAASQALDAHQAQQAVAAIAAPAPDTLMVLDTPLQQIEAVEGSDDFLADRFIECAPHLRWSPGLGWMVDDGVVWARDDALQRYNCARQVCRAIAAGVAAGGKDGEAKRISSSRTVNAVLTMAQSDRKILVPADQWDVDPLLLNTPGGVVDLSTATLHPRGIEYVTQTTSVTPDFEAHCPLWLNFLEQVFLGDAALIEFMQRSMGYWLTGDTREQVIHFLYGSGSNGKSVLTDLMKRIAGTYTVKLAANALMQSKGERHPTELAQLRGKRMALSSEVGETDYFNEPLLKELTGDAVLSARFMRGDFFEFRATQKHVIVGNFKPRLRGGDPAIARRMLLVPFNASFQGSQKDPDLPNKLWAEAPAILAWMIQGAAKWHADGLMIPESVRAASREYMADHDDLALWMDDCCVPSGRAKAHALYASFSAWKRARGENAPSQTAWGTRLSALPGIEKGRSGGIVYTGLSLKEPAF